MLLQTLHQVIVIWEELLLQTMSFVRYFRIFLIKSSRGGKSYNQIKIFSIPLRRTVFKRTFLLKKWPKIGLFH